MQKTELKKEADTIMEKMFEAGAHYGYSKTRRHPSVSPFIYATKNKADIINLEKTSGMLNEAVEFVKNLGEMINMPYVVERWIGGTLSNFTEIKKRITELENYRNIRHINHFRQI